MYRRNDRAVNIRHTHILFETLGKKRERERERGTRRRNKLGVDEKKGESGMHHRLQKKKKEKKRECKLSTWRLILFFSFNRNEHIMVNCISFQPNNFMIERKKERKEKCQNQ